MDKLIAPNILDRSIFRTCDYGKDDCCAIDQQASQDFNIDPLTGRPMYDLTGILRAQNSFEQQRLLDGLDQFKADYLPDDVTDDAALEYYEPRLCQLPSEKADLLAKQINKNLHDATVRKNEEERYKLLHPEEVKSDDVES